MFFSSLSQKPGVVAPAHTHISQLAIPLSVGPRTPLPNPKLPPRPKIMVAEDTAADSTTVMPVEDLDVVKAEKDDQVRSFLARRITGEVNQILRTSSSSSSSSSSSLAPASARSYANVDVTVTRSAVEVVFHPSIFDRVEKDIEARLAILQLSLTHTEEDHSISIDRPYVTLDKVFDQGPGRAPHLTEEALAARKTEAGRENVQAALRATSAEIFGGLAGAAKPNEVKIAGVGAQLNKEEEEQTNKDLTIDLKSLKIGPSTASASTTTSTSAFTSTSPSSSSSAVSSKNASTSLSSSSASTSEKRKPLVSLVSEVDETSSSSPVLPAAPAKGPLVKVVKSMPQHRTVSEDGRFIITISLPLESSGAAVDVDINDSHWALSSGNYEAKVRFPAPIDADSASAKFSKKKKELVITANKKK